MKNTMEGEEVFFWVVNIALVIFILISTFEDVLFTPKDDIEKFMTRIVIISAIYFCGLSHGLWFFGDMGD